jgi:hypothetical protein
VFSAATQFEERQNVRGFLTEARHSLEIYRRKLGSARTWSRLLRRDLDLAAVLRAVGNQSSRKYRKVRSNSNEQGAGCNQHYSHKRGVFIWGSRDPGLSECAFYDNFFSTRRWTYSSLIIDGADRSFSRETYREQLTDAVCVWVKQLESGTAAPRHQRIGS